MNWQKMFAPRILERGRNYWDDGCVESLDWDGNTVTIKKLDEKFIPDMDSVILNSSTTDSTKKFKITVDDSGTIKATEVT